MGFNMVIFVVPWAGTQTHTSPPQYNSWMLNRIRTAIRMAREKDLYVILRIGYPHHLGSGAVPPSSVRCSLLMTFDGPTRSAWVDYVDLITRLALHEGGERFISSFFSWEDFFCIMQWGHMSVSDRRNAAATSQFQGWLKRYFKGDFVRASAALDLSPTHATMPASSFLEIPVPVDGRVTPSAWRFWIAYTDKLWWGLLEDARMVTPLVTMEIRVDKEPAHNARNNDWEWFERDQHATDANVWAPRGVYWAPFWGAPNDGGYISTPFALGTLEIMLRGATSRDGSTRTSSLSNLTSLTTPWVQIHTRKLRLTTCSTFCRGWNSFAFGRGYALRHA